MDINKKIDEYLSEDIESDSLKLVAEFGKIVKNVKTSAYVLDRLDREIKVAQLFLNNIVGDAELDSKSKTSYVSSLRDITSVTKQISSLKKDMDSLSKNLSNINF